MGNRLPVTLRLDPAATAPAVAPPTRRPVISAPGSDDPGDLWWMAASPQDRGEVLRDLLGLVDALPPGPLCAAGHSPLIPAPEPDLASKVVALDLALRAAGVGHGFSGAVALAYYGEPHATRDIPVNVFVAPERHGVVDDALIPLGVAPVEDAARLLLDGQVRMWWGSTPVDVFFAYDRFHDAMSKQVREVPFGQHPLPILAPEHLIVCKVAFNRPKDWLDIEQMLRGTRGLRSAEVRRWLGHVVGTGDPRAIRYAALAAEVRRRGHGSGT